MRIYECARWVRVPVHVCARVCMRVCICMCVSVLMGVCDLMMKQRDLVNVTWNVVDVNVKIWHWSANKTIQVVRCASP